MKNLILIVMIAAPMKALAFECKAGSYLCRRYMSLPDVGINSVCISSGQRSITAYSDNNNLSEFKFNHKPHWRGCAGVVGLWDCDHQIVEVTKTGLKAVRRSVINRVHSETLFELNFANGEANLSYQERDTEVVSYRSYVCQRLYGDYTEAKKGSQNCSQSVQ